MTLSQPCHQRDAHFEMWAIDRIRSFNLSWRNFCICCITDEWWAMSGHQQIASSLASLKLLLYFEYWFVFFPGANEDKIMLFNIVSKGKDKKTDVLAFLGSSVPYLEESQTQLASMEGLCNESTFFIKTQYVQVEMNYQPPIMSAKASSVKGGLESSQLYLCLHCIFCLLFFSLMSHIYT